MADTKWASSIESLNQSFYYNFRIIFESVLLIPTRCNALKVDV